MAATAAGAEKAFSVNVFETIQAAQDQNGLRHAEFGRYRQYCARRLARLRHHGKVKLPQRSGKKYAARPVSVVNAKAPEAVLVQLMLAERAWAHSKELAEKASEDAPRPAHHSLRRLRKAVKEAGALVALVAEVGDARTALEATAYHHLMTGWLHVEMEMWDEALKSLTTASRMLLAMQQGGSTLHQRAVSDRLDMVAPILRLAEHRLDRALGPGTAKAVLAELEAESAQDPAQAAALAKMLQPAAPVGGTAVAADGSVTVQWGGSSHKVAHGKLAGALDKAAAALAAFAAEVGGGGAGDAPYVNALSCLDDAGIIARKEGRTGQWAVVATAVGAAKLQVQLLHGCAITTATLPSFTHPGIIAPSPASASDMQGQVGRSRALLQRTAGILEQLDEALQGTPVSAGAGEAGEAAVPPASPPTIALQAARAAGVQALRTAVTGVGYAHESALAPMDGTLAGQADALLAAAGIALRDAAAGMAKASAAAVEGFSGLVPAGTVTALLSHETALLGSAALTGAGEGVATLLALHRGRVQLSASGGVLPPALPVTDTPAPSRADGRVAGLAGATGVRERPRPVVQACLGAASPGGVWEAVQDIDTLATRHGLPPLQPVPLKPLTFDVAHDFVTLHDISHRTGAPVPAPAAAAPAPAQAPEPAPAPAAGGLLSWLTG